MLIMHISIYPYRIYPSHIGDWIKDAGQTQDRLMYKVVSHHDPSQTHSQQPRRHTNMATQDPIPLIIDCLSYLCVAHLPSVEKIDTFS